MNLPTLCQVSNTGLLILALTVIALRFTTPASLIEPASYLVLSIVVQVAMGRR